MSKTMTDDNPTDKLLVSAFVSFTKLWKLLRFRSFIVFRAVVFHVIWQQPHFINMQQQKQNLNGQYSDSDSYKLWLFSLSHCLWFSSLLDFAFVTDAAGFRFRFLSSVR